MRFFFKFDIFCIQKDTVETTQENSFQPKVQEHSREALHIIKSTQFNQPKITQQQEYINPPKSIIHSISFIQIDNVMISLPPRYPYKKLPTSKTNNKKVKNYVYLIIMESPQS